MKKGTPVSIPTTVEAQIRTRARNLPVHKCLINEDWEDTQLATVFVIRKHTNGNFTMGNYLVDLMLLGVKDCTYSFNVSPLRLDEMVERLNQKLVECDYQLAHNVVYSGLAFAEDYGFAPHKDFKTAQYVLDEDSEDIPLIDIPVGDNGVPVLTVPYGETGQREMVILDKTAGEDYHIVYLNKNGKPETKERTYMEIMDEVMKSGLEEYSEKHTDSMNSFREMQVITDLIYLAKVYSDPEKEQIDLSVDRIGKDSRLIKMKVEPEKDFEDELAQSISYFKDGKIDEASAEFRKVIDMFPNDPLLWDLYLYNRSISYDDVDKEAVETAYSRFPDHPAIKAWYGEWLAQEAQADEVFALYGNAPDLDALTTEDRHISLEWLTSFCYAYAMAWLLKKDALHAEPYYQIIIRLGLNYRLGEDVQEMMTSLKREKLQELFDAGEFGED